MQDKLTTAQKEAVKDARTRGYYSTYNVRDATLRILVNHGFCRKGFIREDPDEVANLTEQAMRAATVDLSRADWRAAKKALQSISDAHGEMARVRWYLTEAGKTVEL